MQKASINLISYILRMNRKAIRQILYSVTEVIVPKYYNQSKKIRGDDVIVEIDESKFGKRKFHKGHHVEGVWVLGLVERTIEKKILLFRVEDRSKNTLEEIIKKM